MLDLSNVIAIALGADDVLQVQDSLGTVLWQKSYIVTITAGSNGSVTVNGVSGNYSQRVAVGTTLTIEGTGDAGYDFDEWSDGVSTNPRTVTVTGDLTLSASFVQAVIPNYFYIEDTSGQPNTLSITKSNANAPTLQPYFSTDQQNWYSVGTTSTTAITATIPANGKLYLKATADYWGHQTSSYGNVITASGDHNVGGNIMSLLNGDNFENTTLDTNYNRQFFYLFYNNTHLVDASDLELPSNVTNYCYQGMFQGCTSLTTPPVLPATTLAQYCYSQMFQGCTSLTTTPVLSATTLANNCYSTMFRDCTSLTTAPVLPATTLVQNCYYQMFQGCSSLTTTPVLPATTLTTGCYMYMFRYCTGLTTAPVLPATTLVNQCYRQMFEGCTSLNTVTTYANDISASNCLNNWLQNVAATGDFYNLGSATYIVDSPSGIPVGWTEHHSLPVPCNVSISSNGNGSVSVNGISGDYSDTIMSDTVITVAATPATGYTFDSWSDGDTNASRTITVTADLTLTATFVLNYFYIEDISGNNNTVYIQKSQNASPTIEPYYSTDGTNWTSMGTTSTSAISATVPANGKLYIKCVADTWTNNDNLYYNYICCMFNFNVGGNIMSLLYGDNFEGQTVLTNTNDFAFNKLFRSTLTNLQDKLINANKLLLPATTLCRGCYYQMFNYCTGLVTAPALPATTMAKQCYYGMFNGCTSLTTPPALPATTMAEGCYMNMFDHTALTTAPALPATDLTGGKNCYYLMFYACHSLTQAPALPATTLAEGCYREMFNSCTRLTQTPALPATTLTDYCYKAMFLACSSLTQAPATLPATTLASDSCANMFQNCTSLTTTPVIMATTYNSWSASDMFNGCTSLNRVVTYANTLQSNATTNWLQNVAATGDFYALGSYNWTIDSPSGVPVGWTLHTSLPEPFYVEDITGNANTLRIKKSDANAPTIEVFSSTDKQTWTSMGTTSTTAITATIPANGKLYLKATANQWSNGNSNVITASGNHNVGGHIMSLLVGDNFENTTLDTNYNRHFSYTFYNSTHLIDASDLVLPSDTTEFCYNHMFSGCTALTAVPAALPATSLNENCYSSMFSGCTALTTAPALPATNLQYYCYDAMFEGCTALTAAPVLAATTLAHYCYRNMFRDCSSLATVTTYANTLAYDATLHWLYGAAATGDFYNLGSATYTSDDSGIPSGWTVHTSL